VEASNSVPVSLLRELRAGRVVCNLTPRRRAENRTGQTADKRAYYRLPPIKQKALAVALSAPSRRACLVVWLGRG